MKLNKNLIMLKIILYVIFLRLMFDVFFYLVSLPFFLFAGFLYKLFNPLDFLTGLTLNHLLLFLYLIITISGCYLIAKIFGIFKFVDSFSNNLNRAIILLLISFVSWVIVAYPINNILNLSLSIFGLVPSYFLYKFFEFLTKKYPKYFKKIGYYCSLLFFKDLITRR